MTEAYFTLKAAAHATGQSQQKFREKVRAGLYPDRIKGKGYDAVAVTRARVEELMARNSAPSGVLLDLTTERARKERAQADKTEFDLAIAKKEYIHISHLEHVLERFSSAAAAKLESVGVRLRQRHPELRARHIDAVRREMAELGNYLARIRPLP